MPTGRSEFVREHGTDHPAGCLYEARWGAMEGTLSRIDTTTQQLHDRLFVGNGTPAAMTRLDRCERVIAVLIWGGATFGGALIVAVVGIVIAMMRG